MEKVLEQHEDMIDRHEDRLEKIQTDLTDIKVRLGLKDITNGNVVKYQEDLVKAQEMERAERKEQDKLLFDRIDKIDDKMWFIVTGIILSVLLEIGLFVVQTHL